MIRYNSRPLQCLHDRMLRKARNNCREPAEVPFRACYSGPLRGAHTPQAPLRSHTDLMREPAPLLSAGPAGFFIRLNSHAMFNEDPLRSQSGVGAGG